MSKPSRLAAVAGVVLIAVLGAYWYWSPYVAMNSMKDAAEARDADTFNQYVDYPKLRESLKGQFSAMMTKEIGKQRSGGSELENAGTALGAMLGLAFADKFIEAMVRPEVVMQAMAEGKMQSPTAGSKAGAAGSEARPPEKEVQWSFERKGVNRVIARGAQGEAALSDSPGFVFDRTGFADWKLTEIRLPANK